jgi:hypothetical protein
MGPLFPLWTLEANMCTYVYITIVLMPFLYHVLGNQKLSETQPSEPRITSPCNARQQHAATIKLHWDGSGSMAESSPG